MHRRITWTLRFAVPGVLLLVASLLGLRGRGHGAAQAAMSVRAPRPPRPLLRGDADKDGLPDALETTLAERYAPVVVLEGRDHNRPASTGWLLARIPHPDAAPGGFPDAVRAGSDDPRDWVTYVHVYPRTDGRINVQYWFFYPYNDGPLFFDHDGDWEHVTVEVAPDAGPQAVYFAQHGNNSPGVRRAWAGVRKLGDHPVVLSARGTHASYADQASLAWFERASACTQVDGCPDPIWRTWQGGGLMNMGERGAVLGAREALAYGGRWGGEGSFLRSRPAPRGPLQQGGFGSDGFD